MVVFILTVITLTQGRSFMLYHHKVYHKISEINTLVSEFACFVHHMVNKTCKSGFALLDFIVICYVTFSFSFFVHIMKIQSSKFP